MVVRNLSYYNNLKLNDIFSRNFRTGGFKISLSQHIATISEYKLPIGDITGL